MPGGLTLTIAGAEEIETAYRAGQTVSLVGAIFGDCGGEVANLSADEKAERTKLINQFGEEPFSEIEKEDGLIGGTFIIDCKKYPNKYLREIGLVSESGTLVAYGTYPESLLPDQTDAVIKEFIIKVGMVLDHADVVTLIVDPSKAILTTATGDERYLQRALNLSDLSDVVIARENLELGTSALADLTIGNVDTTRGRVLKVNDFGIGSQSTLNLWDVAAIWEVGSGVYNIHGPNAANPTLGADAGMGDKILAATVNIIDSGTCDIFAYSDNHVWIGKVKKVVDKVDITWTRVYNTAYKPTAADVGALAVSGNAVSATKLQTARTIGGVSFDGTANINLPGVNVQGNQNTTGNAATATKLQTARTINGVAFDGTANITISAEATGAYGKSDSDARYIQDIRLGSQTYVDASGNNGYGSITAPAGYVLTSIIDLDTTRYPMPDSPDAGYARALQKLINGKWVTVSSL